MTKAKGQEKRIRGRRGAGSVIWRRGAWRARIGIGGGKYIEDTFVGAKKDREAENAAYDWLALQATKRRQGKLEVPEKPVQAPPILLDDLAAAYTYEMTLPTRRDDDPWRPGTLRHFNSHYNGAISPVFGDRLAHTITAGDLTTWLDRQVGRPILHRYGDLAGKPTGRRLSKRTVWQYEAILAQLFRYGCRAASPAQRASGEAIPWLASNPMDHVVRTKVPRAPEKRWLRPAELRAILAAAHERARTAEHLLAAAIAADRYVKLYTWNARVARRDVALFTALIFTGLRIEELMSARWNWLDFEHGLLWVLKAKIGDDRPDQRVALSTRAAAALRAWAPAKDSELKAAGGRLVFPTRDGEPRTNITRHLARILRHADVDPVGVSAHTFRHTFITLLDHAGVRPRVRQALARHVSGTMTDHYTHQEYDDQHAALELLEAQVMRETVVRMFPTRAAAGGQ